MGVQVEQPDPEQQQAETQSTDEKLTNFSKQLAKDLGIGDAELKKGSTEKQERSASAEEAEEAAPETKEEPETSEDASEEDAADSPSEEEAKEEDEDLIPKSKVDRRFAELTAQNKRLEAEVNRMRRQTEDTQATKDDDTKRLEAMDESQLKALKRQVRVAQAKAADDDAKLNQLVELEEKIDDTMRTAPERMKTTQISRLQEAVDMTRAELEDFDKVGQSIYKYADQVYRQSKTLQKSPDGQADAWRLATEHYKALSKASSPTNTNSSELKKQVNKLKKKTSLDTNQLKGNVNKERARNLFKKAKSGTEYDQTDFIKETLVKPGGLVPPEFRGK